jgi:hypothetical protein
MFQTMGDISLARIDSTHPLTDTPSVVEACKSSHSDSGDNDTATNCGKQWLCIGF